MLNRLLILLIGIAFVGSIYGQDLKENNSVLLEINTNYKEIPDITILEECNFKLYNDSLVMTITGGLFFTIYKEKNIPLTVVYPYKFKDDNNGIFTFYSFENNDISIFISNLNNKPQVTIRGGDKDILTGKGNIETKYYYSDWNAFDKESTNEN